VAAWPGNGQVTITWAPPTNPGIPAFDHYGVLMYDGATLVSAIDATSSPLVVTGLINGQTRGYRVVASNSVGSSTDLGPLVTATPDATPFAPLTSWANWVKRLIGDLEARTPTASELSTWGAALANGTQTPASLVEALRSGADNRSNVDPVARLYRAYFLRTPDAGGLAHWIAKRRAGTSLNAISQSFAGSNEFKTRYGRLTNAAFVKLIYKNLFARSGDPGGVTFWTHQLDARLKTRGQVMTGFSESHEYVTKQAGSVEVAAQYVLLLGRAPKPSETALATDPTLTAAWLATRVLNDPTF
jgi:hypothetical protein